MRFCPRCGSLLKSQGDELVCSCGHKEKGKLDARISETVERKKDLEIVDEDDEFLAHPTIEIRCRKCGHNEAIYWLVQTRRSDEPPTRFYKCKKCRRVWRAGG